MHAMFGSFKSELRRLRENVEKCNALDLFMVVDNLCYEIADPNTSEEDGYNKRVIAYRLLERFGEEPFSKQSLLKFLSEWEIEL